MIDVKKLNQKNYKESELKEMTKKELVHLARKRELEASGNKAELITLILEDQGKQQALASTIEVIEIPSVIKPVKSVKGYKG